ncbi:hypothetical protein B0T10DRAFT_407287 [Thelonectria olida]|uniref:Carrier domain-containing protein n=1 Tax=Thelonectria olida TaxID=1576542 RepID=A0A9P8W109_9HYPO|nr:hypothetical protein B0T10DRAFT_407287 [Thelonectria olida]
MSEADPNYFTCTLGQAAKRREQETNSVQPFASVLDLIKGQARRAPNDPALGFADFTAQSSDQPYPDHSLVTFQQLSNLSVHACEEISGILHASLNANRASNVRNIGLLCTSNIRFVATWVALVRLGYSVLLLAPQLELQAIQHLCTVLEVGDIFVDERHYARTEGLRDIRILKVPSYDRKPGPTKTTGVEHVPPASDIALYFHTSGTSSGLPKPIPQTQYGLVGALPSFTTRNPPATFSTTPLYHGGLPDCFRSWTSGAMIWFFPEGVAPITGANLISAINFARRETSSRVKYFSSVPYILQVLAEEEGGLTLLKQMDLVGIGGAALPGKVGDELVKSGVKLLSRLGSAECGFLMSSHRDYGRDKDWQFLRPVNDTELLEFEPRGNGLSELVVKPGWPFKVKSNRDDGSYATADLFESHPSTPNLWRYHSRADAQITLLNGKKFDPSPMEESLRASSDLLRDVFIFGGGRDYPGAILFPNSTSSSQQEIIDSVWPQIDEMNRNTQSHARIARSMILVATPKQGQVKLVKSSKGTILRRQAEERHAAMIESAYSRETPREHVPSDQVESAVIDCFFKVLGRRVDSDEDLYHQGVDSIACIQIRKLIESTCLLPDAERLSANVIYDHGTVNSLVRCLHRIRQTGNLNGVDGDNHTRETMLELAAKYSDFRCLKATRRKKQGNVVVLTGATGFLGSHILDQLRRDAQIEKIYCLVRAETSSAAHERISEALSTRKMSGLGKYSKFSSTDKVICLSCGLSDDNLGLAGDDRRRLLEDATTFIHSAWTVNFNIRLDSFSDQIIGTRNLIKTAAESGAQFVFISSTASVSSSTCGKIPEQLSTDPSDASPLGYSQSKWVAERVCAAASDALAGAASIDAQMDSPVSVIRVGQLCGNAAGIWNRSEAYPLLLSTASLTGCLPELPHEVLNWMPVELAAKAVLEIASSDKADRTGRTGRTGETRQTDIPVYHVTNPHQSPRWKDLLQWILEHENQPAFETVSSSEWTTRLEAALREKDPNHPSHALLEMWKSNLSPEGAQGPVQFDVKAAQQLSLTMQEVRQLDRDRVVNMWKWVCENIRSKGSSA